ncbi:uncharacterized protein [Lepeophtheirus salmonis]|uniref:uncharacterized protein n=1 Tax=Lepeophtheirus salmonis TaxID=72036 RepID=UPI001AE56855|nr:uncharacterized protein LOC121124248 [Lepeophtheirus salmonis]
MVTYFHTFGFIPVFIYLFFNLVYGYNNFDLSNVPLWLVSTIATFFPVCMTTARVSARNRIKIVNLQYKTFKYQAILSFCCYGPSLMAILGIINFYKGYNYDGHIILDNLSFNVNVGFVLFMGFVSIFLSFKPSFNQMSRCIYRFLNPTITKKIINDKIQRESRMITDEMMNEVMANPPEPAFEKPDKVHILPPNKICNIFKNILIVVIIFVPIVTANVIMALTQQSYGYIYFHSNDSYIEALKGIYLNGPQKDVNGRLTFYYATSKDQMSIPDDEYFMDRITQIRRPEWDPSLPSGMLKNSLAIIIIDDSPYRPSSPIPVQTFGSPKMPIILLQTKEGLLLPETPLLMHLTFDPYNVPYPQWSCDVHSSATGTCFKPKINISTRAIVGVQYRKKDCFWGGKPCVGFNNKLEKMDQCEGPEIPLCTKSSFRKQPLRVENTSTFMLEISPRACIPRNNIVQHGDCSIWSKWLKWREDQVLSAIYPGHIKFQRLRYCIGRYNGIPECIFRDNEFIECCQQSKGICDTSPDEILPRCEF